MAKRSVELIGFEAKSLADQITNLFLEWNTVKQVWSNRVREVIQYVYATSTRETSNVKNPWSHSTHIPKITQIHDNLIANYASALFGQREFFDFEASTEDEATETKRKSVTNYLLTKHSYSDFTVVMKALLADWVQTGNAFARLEYVREMGTDSSGEQFVIYEGPKLVRISPYDIVFDPTAPSFRESPKMVRTVMSRGELFRMLEENGDAGEYDQEEVMQIKDFYNLVNGWTNTEINKYIQMQMDGFSTSASFFRSGKVEVLNFMGDIYDPVDQVLHKDALITVIDRRFVVRKAVMKDYQGMGYIYHCAWRKRPDNLWGQGPLDNLVGLQYLINHLENARADGFDQMLTPDRVHIGNVEIEQDGPVTNYWIDDATGDVRNLAPDATVLSADNQIQIKEAQMEAYAGAPREALGIRSPGEKTAFEVSTLANAAGRLFQKKIEDFEEEFVQPILNGEVELGVRNLNTIDKIKVIDDDFGVAEFLDITADDLRIKGKLVARGASHFLKRAQLVQELQGLEQIIAGDQKLAVHFPALKRAEIISEALGFDKFELFVPFGQIEEDMKTAEMQHAAMDQLDQYQAAGDVSAQPPIQ